MRIYSPLGGQRRENQSRMTKRVNCSRELPAPADLKETGKKQFPRPGVRTGKRPSGEKWGLL